MSRHDANDASQTAAQPGRSRTATVGVAGTLAAVTIAGCGLSSNNVAPVETSQPHPKRTAQQLAVSAAAEQTIIEQKAFKALPVPQPSEVNIAGGDTLGITPFVDKAYQKVAPGQNVRFDQTSSAQAFHLMCTGQADIAETTRPPSAAELAQCAANGITFQEDGNGNPVPLELAADGIVIATKNQSDVGGDCLKRSTVRQIFQAGSTINNWSQLGFFNLPLHTTGRDQNSDVFQLFANLVLGKQSTATTGDVRSDYKAETSDAAEKALVTGSGRLNALERQRSAAIAKATKAAQPLLKKAAAQAFTRATNSVLAEIAAENAKLAKTKKVLTKAQKLAISNAHTALLTNARIQAEQIADTNIIAGIHRRIFSDYASRIAAANNPGYVGVFRFTYYELYEQQLRPMEIWDPVTTITELQDEGVAVKSSTAQEEVNNAPRSQAGGGVSTVSTFTFPNTPTAPNATYHAAGGVTLTVPKGGPVDTALVPNCIFPSTQTITSGVYPLSVRLLAYIPKYRLQRPELRSFLAYYLGKGQTTVQNDRLVPLDDTLRNDEYKQVTGQNLPSNLLSSGAEPLGTVGSGVVTGTGAAGSGTQSGASGIGTTTSSSSTNPGNGNTVNQSSGIG